MNRCVFLVVLLLFPLALLADGEAGALEKEQELFRQFEAGVAQARGEAKALVPELPGSEPVSFKSQGDVTTLLDEIEELKSQVVIARRNAHSNRTAEAARSVGMKTVFDFRDTETFEIHTSVNRVTDIVLGPEEELVGAPVSGDTVRWKLAVIHSGSAKEKRVHVIVKPLDRKIATNIILTTNRRTYHLRVLSTDTYMPSVSWNYPGDEMRRLEIEARRKKSKERLKGSIEDLDFNYEVKGRDFPWKPVRAFDDGEKTFLQMPPGIKTDEAPVLFTLSDEDELQLVNYRVKGEYYIVDRLFKRAELRVGEKDRVEIRSKRYEPSFWEEIF